MDFSNFSVPNNTVDNTFQKREARPGDVVMLNDLAADAISKNPVVPDWADAANYAISQPLAESLVRLGTLNAGGADEAWQIVRDARCSEDCSYIGMDLHSTNVVVSIVRNVRDSHGRIVRRKLLNRRVDTRDGGVVLAQVLEPFCDEGRPHIAVVESTYNIYFIADLFELKVLNLRNSETQHHRANLRQLTSKLPGTPTRAELSVSEGRLNLNPSTTNASVGAIAPTEGSSL